MNLRERLEARELEQTVLTIRGEKFVVKELDRAYCARILADCRSKSGKANNDKLEGVLLSECVYDPDTDTKIYEPDNWKAWDKLGRGWTGALMAEVMRLNGLDDDDVEREVKNSDTTGS